MAKSLSELWSDHKNHRFPAGLGGEEIDGIDLVLLDADTAGCIQTAVSSRGILDPGRLEILSKCLADLRSVNSKTNGDAKPYFQRLAEMARIVLTENGRKA